MDTLIEPYLLRLTRIEDDMLYIQRSLSLYQEALELGWDGRDGRSIQEAAERLRRRSQEIQAKLDQLRLSLLEAQSAIQAEEAAGSPK